MARSRWRCRPLEGLTRPVRSGAESLLLPTRQDRPQAAPGQPCVLQATDSGAQIGQMNARRAARSFVCFVDFPEPAELIEGVPHASDRSRSACFCSCARAYVHESGHPICRLFCCLDRHQPSARQPLREHLRHLCPFRYSDSHVHRAIWSGPRGADGGCPPWNSSASATRGGRFSLPDVAAAGRTLVQT
jgi:hypothetical protein